MRRSEICALTVEDISGDLVSINKAVVQDENKNWITKTTKTTSSTREIVIPIELADKIRRQGYVYKGHPYSITQFLEQTERRRQTGAGEKGGSREAAQFPFFLGQTGTNSGTKN